MSSSGSVAVHQSGGVGPVEVVSVCLVPGPGCFRRGGVSGNMRSDAGLHLKFFAVSENGRPCVSLASKLLSSSKHGKIQK